MDWRVEIPSGRVHTATTIGLALGSVCVLEPALTLGILSGLVLSPDLDVDKGFIGLHHLRKIPFVGKALSLVWRILWLPYSYIVPHRSHISHSIFFGTCARVAYLLLPILVLNYFGLPIHLPSKFGVWFLGLCLSDILHIFLDYAVKGGKDGNT